jgi:hypothetical protein
VATKPVVAWRARIEGLTRTETARGDQREDFFAASIAFTLWSEPSRASVTAALHCAYALIEL